MRKHPLILDSVFQHSSIKDKEFNKGFQVSSAVYIKNVNFVTTEVAQEIASGILRQAFLEFFMNSRWERSTLRSNCGNALSLTS